MMKKGISLIVLVITIIVMVILVAAVVITLSNTGIINKANDAVSKTNLKEVEQLASLTWAEEFMAGKRGDTLKSAVLEKLKDYTIDYTITVTDTGVTVSKGSAKELNEYGFYYDTAYLYEGTAAVLTKDGIVKWYVYNSELDTHLLEHAEEVTYEKGKIIFDGYEVIISADGKSIINLEYPDAKLVCSNIEYNEVTYDGKYWAMGYNDQFDLVVPNADNTVKFYNAYADTMDDKYVLEFYEQEHVSGATDTWSISIDGKILLDNEGRGYILLAEDEILFTCSCMSKICKIDKDMTWREWVNSSYNTVGAQINSSDWDDDEWIVFNACEEHNGDYSYNHTGINIDKKMTVGGCIEVQYAPC